MAVRTCVTQVVAAQSTLGTADPESAPVAVAAAAVAAAAMTAVAMTAAVTAVAMVAAVVSAVTRAVGVGDPAISKSLKLVLAFALAALKSILAFALAPSSPRRLQLLKHPLIVRLRSAHGTWSQRGQGAQALRST